MSTQLQIGMRVIDISLGIEGKVIAWANGWVIVRTSEDEEFACMTTDILAPIYYENSVGGIYEKVIDSHTFKIDDLVFWAEDERPYKIIRMTESWCIMADIKKPSCIIAAQWSEVWAISPNDQKELLES